MLFQVRRENSPYLSIPDRFPVLNKTDTNFAEIEAYRGLNNVLNSDKTVEYVGIEHSRRFFGRQDPLPEQTLQSMLQQTGRRVVACVATFKLYNIELWDISQSKCPKSVSALDTALRLLSSDKPEYGMTVNTFMGSNILFLHNMLYTTADIFNGYYAFLRDTLYKYNLQSDDPKLNAHLAERFMTIYFLHNYPLKDIFNMNVTCYSKDLSTIVDTVSGLDMAN